MFDYVYTDHAQYTIKIYAKMAIFPLLLIGPLSGYEIASTAVQSVQCTIVALVPRLPFMHTVWASAMIMGGDAAELRSLARQMLGLSIRPNI